MVVGTVVVAAAGTVEVPVVEADAAVVAGKIVAGTKLFVELVLEGAIGRAFAELAVASVGQTSALASCIGTDLAVVVAAAVAAVVVAAAASKKTSTVGVHRMLGQNPEFAVA